MTQPADKVTFRISSAAAPFVGADKPRQDRLRAAAGQAGLAPLDSVLLVYYLCQDPDPEVKRVALETLRGLDVPFVTRLLDEPGLHPRILDLLVKLHGRNSVLAPLLASHPMLSPQAAAFLAELRARSVVQEQQLQPISEAEPEPAVPPLAETLDDEACEGELDVANNGAGADEADEPVEEDEEYQSKYQQAQSMGIADKIKMAMTGDKEWRSLLIKDSNKLVSSAVIKNPRMTEGEVLTIAKSAVQNDEIIRVICANKDWVKNPLIRKALAENNKTPLPAALRFVATLPDKELAMMAKSKNISSVIASQARRILLAKNKDR